ncbi:LysR family transcriptional regulator [Klenkia sp. PcliD-1-E]|uniref:LysR substrate-binding domain-containing protein n=1 Tax=Klenkia sp. PcliD-1-E TaxID=2954492 RepID=UPI002096CFE5|nr:LysR family transcriptional regulator [Klenkia sp. PcliD-1-E]MCO7222432.1 LysR family transcriptional regulator [Klenkia sp. PcliD-1-E]
MTPISRAGTPPAGTDDTGHVEIRELRAFVAVVEEGALSAAARRLHLSQSALSQTMQSLERQLGVDLLVRTHTGVRTTEAGDLLLPEARSLLAQHDAAVRAVTGSARAARLAGTLRVGVPLELPPELLPTAVAEVAAAFPDTRVEVRHQPSAAQLRALAAGELDVALVRERPADPALATVLAAEEPMGVLVSAARGEQLVDAGCVRLEQMDALDWIGFPRSDSPHWFDQVVATMRAHGIRAADRERGDDLPVTSEVKLAAVRAGRAFALAAPGWGQPLPDGVGWYPLADRPVVRRTWAVWSADARQRDLGVLVAALDRRGR